MQNRKWIKCRATGKKEEYDLDCVTHYANKAGIHFSKNEFELFTPPIFADYFKALY
jgi:hypothetical protein